MPETEESYGGYVRTPHNKPPPRYFNERQDNDMYPFTHLGFNVNDVREKFEGIKGPLTLFAPFPHEDDPRSDTVELDRPVTPINEEIKAPPNHFKKLAKLVRRRISARPDIEHLNVEDQQGLAAIIMGELNGIWSKFRMQVADPFLSHKDNEELQRRITVHIVTACEQLFVHYINKAQILNKRGVFSGPANMSRLKAQLTLDANKFLNVLTVRRYIAEDLRKGQREQESPELERPITHRRGPPKATGVMTHTDLIDASRPKSQQKKHRRVVRGGEVREMQSRMPNLDTTKLLEVIADLPDRRSESKSSGEGEKSTSSGSDKAGHYQRRPSEEITRDRVILKRSNSVPQLNMESLLEELGMDETTDNDTTRSLTTLSKNPPVGKSYTERSLDSEVEQKSEPPLPGTRAYAEDDLRRLVAKPREDDINDDDDLPPLIQALTRSAKHDGKGEILKAQLKELDEREKQRQEAEVITIQGPEHPQPATVPAKMPNNMMVRASDIRVSERVCLSSITLDKNATVYNDLIDEEIDPMTVKKLDSNLFLGDEITEVYTEIMKTVPDDHLLLENDPLVEPAAEGVNIVAALASSTLNRKQDERIINPALQHNPDPPWGELDMHEWAKGGSPPKGMSALTTGALDDLDENSNKKKEEKPAATGGEEGIGEFMARSYASWLLWWKNTINSDDYMKYLSTQETDYMGVVFHFYNSEDEEEEDDVSNGGPKQSVKLHEERERKLDELRAQKTEFKEGLWNVNSILMGGLGKDPLLEGDDGDGSRTKSPDSEKTNSTKAQQTKTKVVSRKQFRLLKQQQELHALPEIETQRDDVKTRLSFITALTNTFTEASEKKKAASTVAKDEGPSAQDRLEKVWNTLRMPDNLRLDMAIKYSSDGFHQKLESAIRMWETGEDLIMKREELVAKLENFERLASDPNRFFEKGHRGSSVARLEEAKIRSGIYKRIETVDEELNRLLADVEEAFGDIITFQGRPYVEKMKWDRTEMLYWLQEERKQQAMDLESRAKNFPNLPMNMVQLEPLAT